MNSGTLIWVLGNYKNDLVIYLKEKIEKKRQIESEKKRGRNRKRPCIHWCKPQVVTGLSQVKTRSQEPRVSSESPVWVMGHLLLLSPGTLARNWIEVDKPGHQPVPIVNIGISSGSSTIYMQCLAPFVDILIRCLNYRPNACPDNRVCIWRVCVRLLFFKSKDIVKECFLLLLRVR